MLNTKTLLAVVTLSAFLATGCALSQSYSEEEIGFRKTNLYTENTTVGDTTNYSKAAPGESQVMARSFENAPPMIPHDVEGLLPITKDMNMCTTCHLPEYAKDVKATPIPKSHFATFRPMTEYVNGAFQKEGETVNNTADIKTIVKMDTALRGERYNCSQCHVPQSNNKVWVHNEFTPDFRDKNGIARSNLIDNLNEGVE